MQVPCVDVTAYCGVAGGDWRVPTPLSWSVNTRLVSFDPPVLTMVIVYVISAPDATGLGDAVLVTVMGLVGSAAAGSEER